MSPAWIRVCLLIVLTGTSGACAGAQRIIDCVFVAEYQGCTYHEVGVQIAPVEGQPLGTAVIPGCGGGTHEQHISVAALPGVSPEVALVWRDVSDGVLVSDGTSELPPEVEMLLHGPRCDPSDAPIDLSGP